MKIVKRTIFAVFALLLVSRAVLAETKTYIWEAKNLDEAQTHSRVILSNQWTLSKRPIQDGYAVFAIGVDGQSNQPLVKNDDVNIFAAFPNKTKAEAVIVGDGCNGSMCHWTDVTLIVPTKTGTRVFPIGDAEKVVLTISDGVVTQARAEGISNGIDKYGSVKKKTFYFNPDAGFVVKDFKTQYAKLVSQHPEKFFENHIYREKLAKAAGLEEFRELRGSIGNARETVVYDGRYVAMQGCVPHNCGGNYGFVLIDGTNGEVWWARHFASAGISGRPKSSSGGTRQFNREVGQRLVQLNRWPDFEEVNLIFNGKGLFAFQKNKYAK